MNESTDGENGGTGGGTLRSRFRRVGIATLTLTTFTPAMPVAAQSATVPISLAWAALGLEVAVAEREFPVHGATFRDVIKHLEEVGPIDDSGVRNQALTTYQLRSSWRPDRRPDSCVLERNVVILNIVIDLPLWTEVAGATETDYRRWRSFIAELTEHEYAHRDTALRAGIELRRALAELRASTCPRLARKLDHLTRRNAAELSEAQQRLDRNSSQGWKNP